MNQRKMSYVAVTLFIVIVIILFSIGIRTAEAEITVWGLRGGLWGKLDSSIKYMYLQGLIDGLAFANDEVQGEKISKRTSHEHLIKALDQFYTDYRNELIPVPFALKVISMELAGREKLEIDIELELLRRKLLEIQKKKAKQGAPGYGENPSR
jgi:hypothetical protein